MASCFSRRHRRPGSIPAARSVVIRLEGDGLEADRWVVFQVLLPGHMGSLARVSTEAWH